MATNRWTGNAIAKAMVVTITVTADDATTTYAVTINGKVVSVLGSGTGVNATAAALQAALVASTAPPEFAEITWTIPASSAVITGTAAVPGKPFTATSSVTGGTGTIGAVTTTVTNSGPNDVNVGANWSLGTVPVSTQDLYVEGGSTPDLLWNLDQLSAVTPNSFNVSASFSGNIGLPQQAQGYPEYRQTYLQFSGSTTPVQIGYGQGSGSGRIKLDFGSTGNTTILVYGSGQPNEFGAQAVRLKLTGASNVLEVTRGIVGVAAVPGETSTLTTLDVGYQTNISGDATVFCGSGVTFTDIKMSGGNLQVNSGATTVTMTAGVLTVAGINNNITTVTVDGGTIFYSSTGTISTLNVGNAGTANFTQEMRSKTVSNANFYKGATITDSFSTVSWLNPFQLVRCRVAEVNLDLGEHRKLLPS